MIPTTMPTTVTTMLTTVNQNANESMAPTVAPDVDAPARNEHVVSRNVKAVARDADFVAHHVLRADPASPAGLKRPEFVGGS